MDSKNERTVTACLEAMERGDRNAKNQLWSLVYAELRTIAVSLMAREKIGHTLQPTAVVHEAFLRLSGADQLSSRNRAYFFSAAAQAMRRILIEHARRRAQPKGMGTAAMFVMEGLSAHARDANSEDIEALDHALSALEQHDQRVYDVVTLRFFAGLGIAETAEALGISLRTANRCWEYGRTWLYREITQSTRHP